MKTKRSTVRLELVADKSGDIIFEPRRAPLLKDTLGISQRAELARLAMAVPLSSSPSVPPSSLAVMPSWAKWIYISSSLLVIWVLIWAFV